MAQAQERPAQASEHPTQYDAKVLDPDDIDPRSLCCRGMLSDRPYPEPQGGPEEYDVGKDHSEEHEVDEGRVCPDYTSDNGEILYDGDGDRAEPGNPFRGAPGAPDDLAHVGGEPHREDVDPRPAHDLVPDELHGEHRVEEPDEPPGEHRDEDPEPGIPRVVRDRDSGPGAGEHRPLEADVHHPHPLCEYPSEGGVGDWGRHPDGCGEETDV